MARKDGRHQADGERAHLLRLARRARRRVRRRNAVFVVGVGVGVLGVGVGVPGGGVLLLLLGGGVLLLLLVLLVLLVLAIHLHRSFLLGRLARRGRGFAELGRRLQEDEREREDRVEVHPDVFAHRLEQIARRAKVPRGPSAPLAHEIPHARVPRHSQPRRARGGVSARGGHQRVRPLALDPRRDGFERSDGGVNERRDFPGVESSDPRQRGGAQRSVPPAPSFQTRK